MIYELHRDSEWGLNGEFLKYETLNLRKTLRLARGFPCAAKSVLEACSDLYADLLWLLTAIDL
jgi:hypothetical protein